MDARAATSRQYKLFEVATGKRSKFKGTAINRWRCHCKVNSSIMLFALLSFERRENLNGERVTVPKKVAVK